MNCCCCECGASFGSGIGAQAVPGTTVDFTGDLTPQEQQDLANAPQPVYGPSPNEGPGLPSTGSTPVAGVPCIGQGPNTGVGASTSTAGNLSNFWASELPYIKGLFGLEGSATFSDFYNGTKSNFQTYYGWTLLEVALISFVVLVLAIMLVHYINE